MTTYTVYDQQDSSNFVNGLTADEARRERDARNVESNYGDRWEAIEDHVFDHYFLFPSLAIRRLRAVQPGKPDDENGVDELMRVIDGPYTLPGVLA